MRHFVQRTYTRANAYFIENWRFIPFQPILFAFLFIGALMVVGLDLKHPTFHDSEFTFWWWISLSLLCPPMSFVSWLLINHFPGKPRYIGLWVRFGADLGQLASVSAFLAAIAENLDAAAAEIYALQVFAAIWWFLFALVVRDSWKLMLTERYANAIHQHREAQTNGD